LTVAGTTCDGFLRHASDIFGLKIVSLVWPSPRWDLADWLGRLRRARAAASARKQIWSAWVSPPLVATPLATGRSRARLLPDQVLAEWADALFLLRLRPGGNLLRVLSTQLAAVRHSGKPLCVCVGTGLVAPALAEPLLREGAFGWYVDERSPPAAARAEESALLRRDDTHALRPARVSFPPADEARYLSHWTRRADGPWPDQTERDFVAELLRSGSPADRSPLAALARILAMQRIVATARLVRGPLRVVSFTARTLRDQIQQRTFRSHLRRWDFEPYGLCVDRQWLQARGAQPVLYGDDRLWQSLADAQRPFFQRASTRGRAGAAAIDWSVEQEWRHIGDLDLRALPSHGGLVFVPSEEAARRIAAISRWPVTVLPSD
jgi:hypothetical protein